MRQCWSIGYKVTYATSITGFIYGLCLLLDCLCIHHSSMIYMYEIKLVFIVPVVFYRKRPMSATGARSASQILSRDSTSPVPPKRPQSAKTFAPRRPMSALSMTSTSHEHCHPKGHSRTTTYPPRPRSATGKESRAKPPNVACKLLDLKSTYFVWGDLEGRLFITSLF